MVNLDKWEKIDRYDIKVGDFLKVFKTYNDGSEFEARGQVHSINETGGYTTVPAAITKSKLILARFDARAMLIEQTIYRRKPEPFKFPTNIGAIIEGEPSHTSGDAVRYIRLSDGWRRLHGYSGIIALEDALQVNFKNWTVLQEGISD